MRFESEILIIDFEKTLKKIENDAFTSIINFYIPSPAEELENKLNIADFIIYVKPKNQELIENINKLSERKDKLVVIIDDTINETIKGSYIIEKNIDKYENIINMFLNTCRYHGLITTSYLDVKDIIKPFRFWKYYDDINKVKDIDKKINYFSCISVYSDDISCSRINNILEDVINHCNIEQQLFSIPRITDKTCDNGKMQIDYLVNVID